MKIKRAILGAAFALFGIVATVSSASAATYTYVGSWSVYNPTAPVWFGSPPNGPLAYTGQEAAALLFGGNAADYVISTIDNQASNINHSAWYDVIGVGGSIFAENYFNKYLGLYYGPTSGFNCCGAAFTNINAASAFVRDNNVTSLNYAFRVSAVPLPAALPLLAAGLGALGVASRRRRKTAA